MKKDLAKILIDERELDEIVSRIASEIHNDYKDSDKPLVLVVILKGSMPFASDLMKRIDLPLELEFMKVSSYGSGTSSSGDIKIHLDLKRSNLQDCNLLVIEDIIDSGRTLTCLSKLLMERGVSNVRTCTLLDKPSRREVEFEPDYCGKVIPNEFVVGYGLDFNEKYRNLPYIGVLSPEIYS